MSRRVDIKAILADPVKRRHMLIKGIMSVQAIEGRYITYEQAAEALDSIKGEKICVSAD
jgi:hypothetical protein